MKVLKTGAARARCVAAHLTSLWRTPATRRQDAMLVVNIEDGDMDTVDCQHHESQDPRGQLSASLQRSLLSWE